MDLDVGTVHRGSTGLGRHQAAARRIMAASRTFAGVRAALLIAVSIALGSACAGQVYTSQSPICFSFNDTATLPAPWNAFPTYSTAFNLIHFPAPTSTTIDQIDVALRSDWAGLQLTVFPTSYLGGPLIGSSIGVFQGYPPTPGYQIVWSQLSPLQGPMLLVGGQTYAACAQAMGYQSVNLPYDPLGASQLPIQWGGCATPSGSWRIGLMARFRGAACAPGPLASVGPQLGFGCGGSVPFPQLASTTPPALGSTWDVTFFGGPPVAGLPVYIFWSLGVNATGSPIAAGSSCLTYLDPVSLGYLASIGAEPIATGTLSPYGAITWTALVPASPSVAGTILCLQALVIGPAGTIPLGGGLFGVVSNGLQLKLGY